MSTFGKKSLVWWDYDNHSKENATRFNHTPEEIQLKILEKWYPIGMIFKKDDGFGKRIDIIYKIEGYVKMYQGWTIAFEPVEPNKYLYSSNKNINPVFIMPEKDCLIPLKREYKLEKILRKWENH